MNKNEINNGTPVILPWVWQLSFKQQTVLITALRGADGRPKQDCTKNILKYLRQSILINADTKSPYMQFTIEQVKNAMGDFINNLDEYNVHFVFHLTHAAEILGHKHPDDECKSVWCGFYFKICRALHIFPEGLMELNCRLGDDHKETPLKRILQVSEMDDGYVDFLTVAYVFSVSEPGEYKAVCHTSNHNRVGELDAWVYYLTEDGDLNQRFENDVFHDSWWKVSKMTPEEYKQYFE